jgi:hypothetical protein
MPPRSAPTCTPADNQPSEKETTMQPTQVTQPSQTQTPQPIDIRKLDKIETTVLSGAGNN